MKDIYRIICECWTFAKQFGFEVPDEQKQTEVMYSMIQWGNDIIAQYSGYKMRFCKKIILALIELYEEIWREANEEKKKARESISS